MIGIYRMTHGCTTYAWLCASHLAERRIEGWTCEKIGEVDGNCRDCEIGRQTAPGYRTPTLVPLVLSPNAKHIPAKGAPETIGRPRKYSKPGSKELIAKQ